MARAISAPPLVRVMARTAAIAGYADITSRVAGVNR